MTDPRDARIADLEAQLIQQGNRLDHCDVARLGAINAHGKAFEEREALRRQLDECAEYLKEGETPAECIQRNRDDATRVLGMLAKDRKALEDARSRLDSVRRYCDDVITRNEQGDTWRMACTSVAANVLNELNGTVHHAEPTRPETFERWKQAIAVACPTCAAAIGARCVGTKHDGWVHGERYNASAVEIHGRK